jgi:lipoprotein-releasing system permease protein
MGYPLTIALRYMGSKKRSIISISTALAIGGVTLGVAALTIVLSVTGGFLDQFREKILGVNAHVLVLKYSIDFREYREVMKKLDGIKGIAAMEPFVINPMMVTHGERTATGVLLKGVDPDGMQKVLDLPKHVVEGSLEGLRRPGARPPVRHFDPLRDELDRPSSRTTDGGTDSLLEWMKREVKSDISRADAGETPLAAASSVPALPAPAPPPPSPSHKSPAPALAERAATHAAALPSGDVTPAGGYRSQLPDEDYVPDAIDPDPCKSPEQVQGMPGLVIGRTLAKQLAVGLGDCVQVTSPQIGVSYGAGSRSPIAKQFRVSAIFEAGFDQYDSKLVYADLYEAQAFYEYGDSVTGVEMKVTDIGRAHDVAKRIDAALNNGIYHTMDWRELNHGLFTALTLQKFWMSAALFLIIVVAACSVIATIIMVVLEKKKEVALLKSLGARRRAILLVFLYQGGMIGVAGAILGVFFGGVACWLLTLYRFPLDPKVYFISSLPITMGAAELIYPAAIAVGICLFVTVFPATYAAWMRPADGLRSE